MITVLLTVSYSQFVSETEDMSHLSWRSVSSCFTIGYCTQSSFVQDVLNVLIKQYNHPLKKSQKLNSNISSVAVITTYIS